jgi:hypothetical protein
MALNSNFAEWINYLNLNDCESVYSLYRSVSECDEYGQFSTKNSKNSSSQWIVKNDFDEHNQLFLANEKMKYAFLKFFRRKILWRA